MPEEQTDDPNWHCITRIKSLSWSIPAMMDEMRIQHWSLHTLFPWPVCYLPAGCTTGFLSNFTTKFHLRLDSFLLFWQCERISVWLRINLRVFKFFFLSYSASSQNPRVFFSLSNVGKWWGSFKGTEALDRGRWGCCILPGWNGLEAGVEIGCLLKNY